MEEPTPINKLAVESVSKNETKPGKVDLKKAINFKELLHFVIIWLLTVVILFGIQLLISAVNNVPPKELIYYTLKSIDTFSLAFSLVLSAFLEQMWNKDKIIHAWNNGVIIAEGLFVLAGVAIYMTYSLLDIWDPSHEYLFFSYSFNINIIYIISSFISVFIGFVSRALN